MANLNAWMMRASRRARSGSALRGLGAGALLALVATLGCANGTKPAPTPTNAADVGAVASDGPGAGADATAVAALQGHVDPQGATVPSPWPATPPRGEPRTAEALRANATMYWDAQTASDFKTLFLFRDPDLPETVDEATFVSWHEEKAPLAYRGVVIHDAVVDGRYGWVDVGFESRPRLIDQAPWNPVRTWEPWYYWAGRWLPVSREKREAIPAAPPTRNVDLEPSLRARYDAWWKARFDRDFQTLYELSDPLDREQVAYDMFEKGHAQLDFTDHRVEWAQVQGDAGGVRVSYMIAPNDPSLAKMPPQLRIVTEPWVLRDGVWYHKLIRGGAGS